MGTIFFETIAYFVEGTEWALGVAALFLAALALLFPTRERVERWIRAQQELVDRSLIDASSMVAVIDELEELGLAERRAHPGDRRKHAVHLTAGGRRTLERAREVAIETAKRTFAPLSASEVETLRGLLRKLAGVPD